MTAWTVTEDTARLFRVAEKELLVSLADRRRGVLLDRVAIETILPHRDPFLLLDRVFALAPERGLVAAAYDLSRARDIFTGHFPGHPIWPGVLQVEAIAQAGALAQTGTSHQPDRAVGVLTHVIGARFIRPVGPEGEVEILALGRPDGLFFTIVGQCVYEERICSVAAVATLDFS